MADFTSGFWSWYIIGITAASIAFCLYVLLANSKKMPMTADNTTGHVWDGDIREANNPLPRWWVWLFLLTMVFGAVYLALYPGLGANPGMLKWSQAGQYQAERTAMDQQAAPLFSAMLTKTTDALVRDAQAKALGERIFLNNCAQCHGADARGSKGFPNLTDQDNLYPHSAESIKQTISTGRAGVMPPLGAALGGEANVENVAQYVLSLSKRATDSDKAAAGKPLFAVCAACHGAAGEGNPAIGAPRLSDDVWLHGGGLTDIMNIIRSGKTNSMPEHASKLSEGQIHVLTAYVMGLRAPTAPSAGTTTVPAK